MTPPLSGEASRLPRSQLVRYKSKLQKTYETLINLELQLLPPLKGEVAKVDNFYCQLLTEGSAQPINLVLHFYRHNELSYMPSGDILGFSVTVSVFDKFHAPRSRQKYDTKY